MSELKVSDILKKKGSGFKAVLEVDLPDLKVVVPIRHETMNSKDVKEKHKVVLKDSTGQEVFVKMVGEKKEKKHLTEAGTEAIGSVQAYQDGVAVEPFEKTEDIKIVKTAPKEYKEQFLLEKAVEIWTEEVDKLYKVADYLHSNNLIGLASFITARGYDNQYLALIEPRFIDGNKFGIIAFLTKKKIEFNHLLDLADMSNRVNTQKARGLELIEGIL